MIFQKTRIVLFPALVCVYATIAFPVFGSPGPKYVSLRGQFRCNRKLGYGTVQANAANYVGQVFELRGTVGEMIETEEGISVMLNLADKSAVTLDIPRSEIATVKEITTPVLRVLVKVSNGASGNVVPLSVLAVAHDYAVSGIEKAQEEAAQRTENARRERQMWREKAARSVSARGSATLRGGYVRLDPTGSGSISPASLGERVRSLFPAYLDFIARQNPRLNMGQAEYITFHLLKSADQNSVDPRLIVAMILAESGFNPQATSRTGAMGLGQLMPGTAAALGVSNAYDPAQNLAGSVNYLRSRLDTFGWRVDLAMAAYNAGANAVKKHGGIPPFRETQAYVKRVIRLYQELAPDVFANRSTSP